MDTKELLKKVRLLELQIRGPVNQVLAGEYHSAFKGRGMAFSEVREYMPGDEIRAIDWNVTARMNHPYVKIFEEERELTVMVLCDLSGSQYFGSQAQLKKEMAVELAAILSFSAMNNNDKVGALLFTERVEKFIPPRKGRSHALSIISQLISFNPERPGTNIAAALEYISLVLKKRSIVFLISDFQNTGYLKALQVVGRQHDLVAVHLRDPREEGVPNVGLVSLRDAETGKTRWIDTTDRRFRTLYAVQAQQDLERKRKEFLKADIDAIEIRLDTSYMRELTKFFKKREKRR